MSNASATGELAFVSAHKKVWNAFELRFHTALNTRTRQSPERQQILAHFANILVYVRDAIKVYRVGDTECATWFTFTGAQQWDLMSLFETIHFNSAVDDPALRANHDRLERTLESAILGDTDAYTWRSAREMMKSQVKAGIVSSERVRVKVDSFFGKASTLLLGSQEGSTLWSRLNRTQQNKMLQCLTAFDFPRTYSGGEGRVESFADIANLTLGKVLGKAHIRQEDLIRRSEDDVPPTGQASVAPARRQRALVSHVLRSSF